MSATQNLRQRLPAGHRKAKRVCVGFTVPDAALPVVILASTSPHKMAAVFRAFRGHHLRAVPDVPSLVPEQPYGMEQIIKGAAARLTAVHHQLGDTYPTAVWLGIESGIVIDPVAGDCTEVGVIVKMHAGTMTQYSTTPTTVPRGFVAQAKAAGVTVGQVVAAALGGEATDPQSTLLGVPRARERLLALAMQECTEETALTIHTAPHHFTRMDL
jgi:non-canonical (house-cleaning) NTP pyrophosphatase